MLMSPVSGHVHATLRIQLAQAGRGFLLNIQPQPDCNRQESMCRQTCLNIETECGTQGHQRAGNETEGRRHFLRWSRDANRILGAMLSRPRPVQRVRDLFHTTHQRNACRQRCIPQSENKWKNRCHSLLTLPGKRPNSVPVTKPICIANAEIIFIKY
jgi:hypothetical protein